MSNNGSVSLDDLQSRFKKLEMKTHVPIDKNPAPPKTMSLGLKNVKAPVGFSLSLNEGSPVKRHQKRPSTGLDFTNSSPNSPANQRKKNIAFALPTQSLPAPMQNDQNSDVSRKLKEVYEQNGNLRINGEIFRTNVNSFRNLGEIGAGSCGQVYKMEFKTNKIIMAVKQMHRSGNTEESKRILMDLDVVQKSHDCPYIVTCYGTLITESHVWICMELMTTCFDKLNKKIKGPMPEQILGKLTVSVVKALHYLKENHGVIHRDVKPSNILVDRYGRIKLCDFGISGRLVDSMAKTRSAGCAAYMAPERIDPPDPLHPDYDIRADVWSLGISLVELAVGFFPYTNCKTDFEVLSKVILQESPKIPAQAGFSIHFQEFVKQCCMKNHNQRPKYLKLLSHPFIKHYEQANVNVAKWLNTILPDPTFNPFATPPFITQSQSVVEIDPFIELSRRDQPQLAVAREPQRQTHSAPQRKTHPSIDDLLS